MMHTICNNIEYELLQKYSIQYRPQISRKRQGVTFDNDIFNHYFVAIFKFIFW